MTRIYSTAEVQAVGAAWAIDPAIGAKVERALGHETTVPAFGSPEEIAQTADVIVYSCRPDVLAALPAAIERRAGQALSCGECRVSQTHHLTHENLVAWREEYGKFTLVPPPDVCPHCGEP